MCFPLFTEWMQVTKFKMQNVAHMLPDRVSTNHARPALSEVRADVAKPSSMTVDGAASSSSHFTVLSRKGSRMMGNINAPKQESQYCPHEATPTTHSFHFPLLSWHSFPLYSPSLTPLPLTLLSRSLPPVTPYSPTHLLVPSPLPVLSLFRLPLLLSQILERAPGNSRLPARGI